MLSELRHWWKTIRTAILAIGVLLSFLAFVEVLHVYVILRDTYAALGYGFLLLIGTGFIWFLAYIYLAIRKRAKVLASPDIEDLTTASRDECRTYCRYLVNYLQRLTCNPYINGEDIALAHENITRLERLIETNQQPSVLLREIDKTENEIIEHFLSKLDEKAEAEIQTCVRDIMLGVTLSPFRAVDLAVVIYRNAAMVFRIMSFYNSRPLLSEQVLMLRDVFSVVATVNYLNFGEKLIEQLFSRVPWIGQAVDDFAQGIGAGLLTSVAGHGAIFRCRAYKRWDQETAAQTMSVHVKGFMNDVKNMFIQDVLPKIRNRVYSIAQTDQTSDPGFWEKTTNGISSALDATDTMIEILVKRPVIVGSRGTIKVGSTAISKGRSILIQGADGIWRATKIAATEGLRAYNLTANKAKKIFRNYSANKTPRH